MEKETQDEIQAACAPRSRHTSLEAMVISPLFPVVLV